MNEEQLQFKYGLSPLGWSEMEAKLARVAKGEAGEATPASTSAPARPVVT
jgi:hypothetical protein